MGEESLGGVGGVIGRGGRSHWEGWEESLGGVGGVIGRGGRSHWEGWEESLGGVGGVIGRGGRSHWEPVALSGHNLQYLFGMGVHVYLLIHMTMLHVT